MFPLPDRDRRKVDGGQQGENRKTRRDLLFLPALVRMHFLLTAFPQVSRFSEDGVEK